MRFLADDYISKRGGLRKSCPLTGNSFPAIWSWSNLVEFAFGRYLRERSAAPPCGEAGATGLLLTCTCATAGTGLIFGGDARGQACKIVTRPPHPRRHSSGSRCTLVSRKPGVRNRSDVAPQPATPARVADRRSPGGGEWRRRRWRRIGAVSQQEPVCASLLACRRARTYWPRHCFSLDCRGGENRASARMCIPQARSP